MHQLQPIALYFFALCLALTACCPGSSSSSSGTTSSGSCSSPDECPSSLCDGQECCIVACDTNIPGATVPGCHAAPAPAGYPCGAVSDAGIVVCPGTCDPAGVRCVFAQPIPPTCGGDGGSL